MGGCNLNSNGRQAREGEAADARGPAVREHHAAPGGVRLVAGVRVLVRKPRAGFFVHQIRSYYELAKRYEPKFIVPNYKQHTLGKR